MILVFKERNCCGENGANVPTYCSPCVCTSFEFMELWIPAWFGVPALSSQLILFTGVNQLICHPCLEKKLRKLSVIIWSPSLIFSAHSFYWCQPANLPSMFWGKITQAVQKVRDTVIQIQLDSKKLEMPYPREKPKHLLKLAARQWMETKFTYQRMFLPRTIKASQAYMHVLSAVVKNTLPVLVTWQRYPCQYTSYIHTHSQPSATTSMPSPLWSAPIVVRDNELALFTTFSVLCTTPPSL